MSRKHVPKPEGLASLAGRFDADDLADIVEEIVRARGQRAPIVRDEASQPGSDHERPRR